MGLDLVEFMIAVEGSFGVDIPDADLVALKTPRQLIDYLAVRLPVGASLDAACRTQRAFYRTRTALAARFGVPPRAVRPDTPVRSVLGRRVGEWSALGKDLGADAWPHLKSDGWTSSFVGGVRTVGELSRHLAVYEAAAVRHSDASWSRAEIEALVLELIEAELGVKMDEHTLDSRFVRDMGIE